MIELADAAWLAHRYDETTDSFRFLYVPRETHSAIAFLDDEYLPQGSEQKIIARRQIVPAEHDLAPLHFIFHSGFCCSTLLAHALNQPGIASSLSEPTILRDMVGYAGRSDNVKRLVEILHQSLKLLARPFEQGEAVVVKPSCTVNGIQRMILTMRPNSHALFLHAPIRVFLNSIARKGITGRLWARELFLTLRKAKKPKLALDLGFNEDQLFGQTDLQIAGLAWLAQNIYFNELLAEFGAERVRSLDSESFLINATETLIRLGRLFDLDLDSNRAKTIANSDVFHRHSKSGDEFDASQRDEDRAAGENAHADEIEKVAQWVEIVAQGLNAPMTPGGGLMG